MLGNALPLLGTMVVRPLLTGPMRASSTLCLVHVMLRYKQKFQEMIDLKKNVPLMTVKMTEESF